MKNLSRSMLMVAVIAAGGTAVGDIVDLTGVPDLSQHAVTSPTAWANYCAPTAGANVAYYFGQTYSNLLVGDSLPGSTSGANNIIAGGGLLPPGPGSMADLMVTSLTGGTTANNLRTGLDAYLENRWDNTFGGSDWNTVYLESQSLTGGGTEFWGQLQTEISNGSGVILLIAWIGVSPPEGYDLPDGYDGSTTASSALGHAVTMNGYNTDLITPTMTIRDPANNGGGSHTFSPTLSADTFQVNVSGTSDITIDYGGGSIATIYGAVFTNIPSPGALSLLLVSGLLARRRRQR